MQGALGMMVCVSVNNGICFFCLSAAKQVLTFFGII